MANRLFKNIVWTQRANFIDLPTDCPQRDERFGWMGDAQIYVRAATYNADVAAFYTKWLRRGDGSTAAQRHVSGLLSVSVSDGLGFRDGLVRRGRDLSVDDLAGLWRHADHRALLADMVKFMDWRKATSKNFLGVVHGNDWGDWLSFGEKTPLDYVDTGLFSLTRPI